MAKAITKQEILQGMDEGIVRLVLDPNMESGTVCEIGGSWFYFDIERGEDMDPDEYAATVPRDDVARMVCEALQGFEQEAEYSDEWGYYRAVLDERLGGRA